MRILGIISEYDPFHNGHKYMLQKLRSELKPDAVVSVMSGEFTQRGMPAYFDKMKRAEMAVMGGIDLALELPYIYACNSSAEFAKGGIGILKGLGCITHIGFGAETDDIDVLTAIAEAGEDYEISSYIRNIMSKGISYAEALTSAFGLKYGRDMAEILRHPNNLLAIEYLRAMRIMDADFEPLAVKRLGAMHDGTTIDASVEQKKILDDIGSFSSGSEIRKCLAAGRGIGSVRSFLPDSSFELLERERNEVSWEKLYELLKYRCLTSAAEELSNILEINEGIENRIKKYIAESNSFDDLIMAVKSKRYTMARIRRMLIHILMNIKKSEFAELKGNYYARVLAFNSKGAELIRKMKDNSEIPIISNLNRVDRYPEKVRRSLHIDSKSVDLYDILSENKKRVGRDRRTVPFRHTE